MAERAERIEQYAHKIWENRTGRDCDEIEKQCGVSGIDWLKWSELPEGVKDHVRDLAEEQVAFMQTLPPPTEIEQYLTSLFRELERLRPTHFNAISHGIAWDREWDRLILLVNRGDVASLHPLNPGHLTGDAIATAAKLAAKVEAEINNPDSDDNLDYISIKR
jgi:hypothetical protein